MTATFDLAIIGSGSAAFAAAIAAAGSGARVVMVERGTVGGTCVNAGCVPSKALLAAAAARHGAAAAARFPGLSGTSLSVAFPGLISGKDALVDQLRGEKYLDLADRYGWQIMPGSAALTGDTGDTGHSAIDASPALAVTRPDGGTTRIAATSYLIATGSAPWCPPADGLPQAGYLTSATAMELAALPDSLLVIAAGMRCDCRVLDMAYVPRAMVDRDTRGLVKIVAEAGTCRVLGVHAVTDGAGDLITAAGYAVTAGMTVGQLARAWTPYLTTAEALKLAAQSYTVDVAELSCCAG